MRAIIGLGNPGPQYEGTRHNVGFEVVARLADARGVRLGPGQLARVARAGADLLLAQPLTFMNRSGLAVAELAAGHGLRPEDLVVVHDDLDLPLGDVRVKVGGGHGGHNGLRSILESLGEGDFVRVRLGIGREESGQDAADWVLSPFPERQLVQVRAMIDRAVAAVEAVLRDGAERAMNAFNRRPEPIAAPPPAG